MTRHRYRVLAELVLSAAGGGAAFAVVMAWSDPASFDPFNGADWAKLARVALTGAFVGVFNLLRQIPRSPTAYERREDPPAVEKQAEKLGLLRGNGKGGR